MTSTPLLDAYLATRELRDEFAGMTAEQIRRMSMEEYGRVTGRSPRPSAARATVTPTQVPTEPESGPESLSEPMTGNPEPVSVASMTSDEYAAYRKQIGMGQSQQYGVGILNAVSGPKASNGRHAMITSNVEPSPAINMDGRLEDRSARLDNRSAAQRFSTPGNSYQG